MGHILLSRCFQRIFQSLVKHDALLGIDGQLVDQGILGSNLVVQTVDKGLEHGRVTFQCLAFGQQFLFLGLLFIIFRGQLRALAFQFSPGRLISRRCDFVFDIHQHRIEFFNPLLRGFQIGNGTLAALDHLQKARL